MSNGTNGNGINVEREELGEIKHRKSVRNLDNEELKKLRNAFRAVMGISDDRGYQHFAGIHGVPPPEYCEHGTPLFFPWHRAYLYFFEQALQDQVKGVTLPWWDWTSTASRTTGLPRAYTVQNVSGQPNHLRRARIAMANRNTRRNPGAPLRLPSRTLVNRILDKPNFIDFSDGLEGPHGNIHGWVGGDMGRVAYAAYDPIFWAHHAMVDRLWWLWQLRHPGSGPPSWLMNRALPPFQMTVAETLDINDLGYDYAAAEIAIPIGG